MTITVRDAVLIILESERLDGLCNEIGECACLKDDLAPCGHLSEDCCLGRKIKCGDGKHDWYIEATDKPVGENW